MTEILFPPLTLADQHMDASHARRKRDEAAGRRMALSGLRPSTTPQPPADTRKVPDRAPRATVYQTDRPKRTRDHALTALHDDRWAQCCEDGSIVIEDQYRALSAMYDRARRDGRKIHSRRVAGAGSATSKRSPGAWVVTVEPIGGGR